MKMDFLVFKLILEKHFPDDVPIARLTKLQKNFKKNLELTTILIT